MFWTVTLSILRGCGEAANLFFLTLLFGLPLGLPIAFGSMSKWAPFRFLSYGQRPMGRFTRWLSEVKPIRALTNVIVWVIRGTPLVLQLIIIFYGPGLWFDHNPWNVFSNGRMFACALAFIINYACYFSEIYRGGIESVPVGQTEAGQVLGMTKTQIFFKVTLLQVVKRILPPMGNEIITLVKDTSLANVIANKDIIMMAKEYSAKGLIWPLFSTAVFFLVFVGALTLLFGWLEKRLDYFK